MPKLKLRNTLIAVVVVVAAALGFLAAELSAPPRAPHACAWPASHRCPQGATLQGSKAEVKIGGVYAATFYSGGYTFVTREFATSDLGDIRVDVTDGACPKEHLHPSDLKPDAWITPGRMYRGAGLAISAKCGETYRVHCPDPTCSHGTGHALLIHDPTATATIMAPAYTFSGSTSETLSVFSYDADADGSGD